MRQDVVRRSRGVARYNKPSMEELAEYGGQRVNHINDTGNSGLGRGDACPNRSVIPSVFTIFAYASAWQVMRIRWVLDSGAAGPLPRGMPRQPAVPAIDPDRSGTSPERVGS